MDYTYQNSPSDKPKTLLLDEFNLTIFSSGQETVYSYSKIIEVQLDRSERKFKTFLSIEGGKVLTITNRIFGGDKMDEEQSRAYSIFVRVLHFHLKEKSCAVFSSGSRKGKILNSALSAVLISLIISFTAEYCNISLVNPFVQAAVLASMMGIVILSIHIGKRPKHYEPSNIPLDFLP